MVLGRRVDWDDLTRGHNIFSVAMRLGSGENRVEAGWLGRRGLRNSGDPFLSLTSFQKDQHQFDCGKLSVSEPVSFPFFSPFSFPLLPPFSQWTCPPQATFVVTKLSVPLLGNCYLHGSWIFLFCCC